MMDSSRGEADFRPVTMESSFKGPPMQTSVYEEQSTDAMGHTSQSHSSISSSSDISRLSEEFEHILSSSVKASSSLHHNVEPDRPEISMQIRNVEHALQSLSEGTVASEITAHLSELVPKIIRLEHKVKMQSTLQGIFEEENQKLKTQIEQLTDAMDTLSNENGLLQAEIAELKEVKQDKELGEFDYVTKKEANEIKDANAQKTEKQETTKESPGTVTTAEHFNLQQKYQCLKKQIEEIVKVNHSWDDHYRNMKAQLEAHIKDLKEQLDDTMNKANQAGDEKTKDDMIMEAHARIDKADKKHAEAVAEVVAVNQKCEKLERYARTLTIQRSEMEKEIKRLNEALAHKLNDAFSASGGMKASQEVPVQTTSSAIQLHGKDKGSEVWAQNVEEDMTTKEMKEALELLRQQAELFQSDFIHERQDRQRVIGELDALQKELWRTKRQLQQQEQQNMMYEDEQIAHDLQRRYQHELPHSTSAPARDYGYFVYKRPPQKYRQPMYPEDKAGHLIAHGKGNGPYNLAGNDLFIDGDAEVDEESAVIVGYPQEDTSSKRKEQDQPQMKE
jgi:hypothetical protein